MLKLHYIHQTPSHAKTSLHLPNTLTCQNVNTSTKSPYMPKPQPVYHTSYTPRRQSVYPLTHKTSCSPSLIISIPSGLTCRFSLPTKPNRIAKTSVTHKYHAVLVVYPFSPYLPNLSPSSMVSGRSLCRVSGKSEVSSPPTRENAPNTSKGRAFPRSPPISND